MLTVAIAAEAEYDREIFRHLISLALGVPVATWASNLSFTGCNGVIAITPLFLTQASRAGIHHALLAIDNDGGSTRRLEHEDSHVPHGADPADGCRECVLLDAIPNTWASKTCIAVPTQTIETWLLSIRGVSFVAPTPEQYYNRPALKRQFFGKGALPIAQKILLATQELNKPTALSILRQRPSFQRFEARLVGWP